MRPTLRKSALALTTAALAAGFTITAAAAPAHASSFEKKCPNGIGVQYIDKKDALVIDASNDLKLAQIKVVRTPVVPRKGPRIVAELRGRQKKTWDGLKYAIEDSRYTAKITCSYNFKPGKKMSIPFNS